MIGVCCFVYQQFVLILLLARAWRGRLPKLPKLMRLRLLRRLLLRMLLLLGLALGPRLLSRRHLRLLQKLRPTHKHQHSLSPLPIARWSACDAHRCAAWNLARSCADICACDVARARPNGPRPSPLQNTTSCQPKGAGPTPLHVSPRSGHRTGEARGVRGACWLGGRTVRAGLTR